MASVHQVLATLHHGDAMGNEALAIRAHLTRAGFRSEIFAERVDPRLIGEARPLSEYQQTATPETICLFHFSLGREIQDVVYHSAARLALVYHNLTPTHFFQGFDDHLAVLCHRGRRLLGAFPPRTTLAIAKSEFSRRELTLMGFRQTAVLPVVLSLDRYRKTPTPVLLRQLRDGRTNILFVGRLVPNKGSRI